MHAHRREVVDLVELAALLGHLRVDRVEVLGAAGDLRLDAQRLELLEQVLAGLGHVALALLALLGHQVLDLLVLARVQGGEGEVLELPLDRVDAEAVGDRAVDVERLLGLVDLLLLRHGLQRAHVVEAVGELDEDDPDVGGHRDHHLAVVLGLGLVARLEGDARQLGDAVDQAGDLVAELLAHLLERGAGVLDRVVQQRGAQRLGVEAHARADLGHAHRVGDEVLARLAALVGVVLAGEDEGLGDLVAVDLDGRVGRVLLDDREQVGEQARLGRREAEVLAARAALRRVVDGPDRLARRHGARRALPPLPGGARPLGRRRLALRLGGGLARSSPALLRGCRARAAVPGGGLAAPLHAARAVCSLRYRSASSRRCS